MSVAYYIVLDREVVEFDASVNGKFVAAEFEALDALTEDRLSEWVSSETLDFYMPEIELPPVEWIEAQEGIALFQRLRQQVEGDPARFREPVGLVSDLDEYLGVLRQAAEAGARFHLALDL